MNAKYVTETYQCLLHDISLQTGLPLVGTAGMQLDWLLLEGPRVDKQLLRFLEGDAEFPQFPDFLSPLADLFREKDDPLLLRHLRTLLAFAYKAEHEPTSTQLKEAQASFEEADDSCGAWDTAFNSSTQYPHTYHAARRVISRVISRINWAEITPAHGPGAVFPPRRPSRKSDFGSFYPSIASCYPYDQFFFGIPSFWEDILVRNDSKINMSLSITAKMTAVPKDSRGPRLICVHPAESIWIQQGQRRLLERSIMSSRQVGGRINFDDQSVNQQLALTSSKTREFVTLDLKEASDRLSYGLVKFLLGDYANSWLSCSRATHIKMLDGRVRNLNKWAPMGNCLTFPIQSLIFWSLVHAGIESFYGVCCNRIYVFGDDIIYPTKYHEGVIKVLTGAGLIPNTSKTFVRGFFRESCGVDAYKGIDVTPLRLKKGDINSAKVALGSLDLARRARFRGHSKTGSYIVRQCRKWAHSRGVSIPITNNPLTQGLAEYLPISLTELLVLEPRIKYNAELQYWYVPIRLVMGVDDVPDKDDWYHLQDSLLALARGGSESPVSQDGLCYPYPKRFRMAKGQSQLQCCS